MKKPLNILSLLLVALMLLSFAAIAQKRDSVMFGVASYYHQKFQGRKTSNGEIFRNDSLTAAHKYLPFGTRVRVTNLNNDSTVIVRINDRLPQSSKRSIDLSQAAARRLDMMRAGIVKAKIEILPYDVLKVSPQFASYLLNRNGMKITPGIREQLKSGKWTLSYIIDTLNGKVLHSPAKARLILYYDDSLYIASSYQNNSVGKWTVADSVLMMHKEIKRDSVNWRNPELDFTGPFLLYRIDTTMLVLGKPLSSDNKWHRNYHFNKEPMEKEFKLLMNTRKTLGISNDSLLTRYKTEQAEYDRKRDSVYSTYPLGITREPQRKIGGCTVETVIFREPGKTTVYEKKTYDWNGIFFFKNNVSINQETYEKETGIK